MTSSGPALLLIVFNRPDHTRRVLERVLSFSPSRLYVAADGPRPGVESDIHRCAQTRALFTTNTLGQTSLKTLFRDENRGCGLAVSEAIQWFFSHEECGIILEDDCLPMPGFYDYMTWALKRFRERADVWHVSAMGFPNAEGAPCALSRMPFIWGWGSWREKWNHYQYRISDPPRKISKVIRNTVPTCEARDYWTSKIVAANSGTINTWDYQWVYALWRGRGASLIPSVSLVENIGTGDDATHTRISLPSGYAPLSRETWNDPPATMEPETDPSLLKLIMQEIFELRRSNLAYFFHLLAHQKPIVYLRLGVARRLRARKSA